jgi:hypothetical protein
MGLVYFLLDITNTSKTVFRVGKTSNNDLSRPKSQQAYLPFKTELFCFYSNDYSNLETKIHRKLKDFKLNGDWYNFDFFELIKELYHDESVEKVEFPSLFTLFSKITN